MNKSVINLIFVSILLGGIILSTILVAKPTELEPLKDEVSPITRHHSLLHAVIIKRIISIHRGEIPAQTIMEAIRSEAESRGD